MKDLATVRSLSLALSLAASLGVLVTASACSSEEPTVAATLVDRGRYLVENVGLCTDCHTPRGAEGEFDKGRWLCGAVVDFKPTVEMPWATVAPPIAGLGGIPEADIFRLLTQGIARTGAPPRPPMPGFRLTDRDARAVIAYLKTLPVGGAAPAGKTQ